MKNKADTELVLFIPAAQTARLYPFLEAAAQGRAKILRDKALHSLDLSSLCCLNISMHGSGERVRTPMVYPFMRTERFNFETPKRAPHELSGPDWMVLGGNGEDLGRFVAQALTTRIKDGEQPTLRIRPYASLCGSLPQEPQPSDTPFIFRKSSKNTNHPVWIKNLQSLSKLPEERWPEVGIANTADLIGVFDEALARIAPPAPRLILDLGCGLGQIARTLAQRYPDAVVVGMDASAEAIAVANQAFCLPNLRYCVVDFSRPLSFPQGSVDLIVSTNALPYAREQLKFSRELFTLLSPQGLLLNHCRAEEAHLFWDFPLSLLLPSNTQLFLSDWFFAARESNRNTEVLSVPLGMSAQYFQPNQAKAFAESLNSFAEIHRHDGPGPYAPWTSHVFLAHSNQAQASAEDALPLAHNHLARLSQVLNAMSEAPRQIQVAAVLAWVCTSKMLEVLPEALEFFAAVLPGSAPVLKHALAASFKAK
ncbi:MAG: class I SAM-dependent methyltransferase [Humidesulfovibrio sp.]|nr:class I SAM-dependent methyltransferase [Humidesulfovibrio sp.]